MLSASSRGHGHEHSGVPTKLEQFFFPKGDCKPMTSNKSFGAPPEELPSEASNLASLGAEIWSPDGNWETAGVSTVL